MFSLTLLKFFTVVQNNAITYFCLPSIPLLVMTLKFFFEKLPLFPFL